MTENLTKTIMDERKAFSFGFSKKVNNKPLEKSKLHEENEKANDQDPDFITSLEDREVKGYVSTRRVRNDRELDKH